MHQEQEYIINRIKIFNQKDEEIYKVENELCSKSKFYEEQIQMAKSDKEEILQSLKDQQALNLKEMNEYFEAKVS